MVKVRAAKGKRYDECDESGRFFSPEWKMDLIMCETKIIH